MIKKELLQIAKILNQAKIAYSLVGGLAVSTWVEPRSTKGIDLIVADIENKQIIDKLEEIGFTLSSAPMKIGRIKFKSISKLLFNDELLMLDLMQFLDDNFNQAILNGATKIKFEDIEIKVASPEDVIILKSFSERKIDKIDIENMSNLKVVCSPYDVA
jgi:predicted nucleotidyltransferase